MPPSSVSSFSLWFFVNSSVTCVTYSTPSGSVDSLSSLSCYLCQFQCFSVTTIFENIVCHSSCFVSVFTAFFMFNFYISSKFKVANFSIFFSVFTLPFVLIFLSGRSHRNFNDWNVFLINALPRAAYFCKNERVQVTRCEKYVMECSFFARQKNIRYRISKNIRQCVLLRGG